MPTFLVWWSFRKQVSFVPPNQNGPFGPIRLGCGERGIRTPGPVTVNGFQDRRNRPLCHLSAANVHPKAVLEPINPPGGHQGLRAGTQSLSKAGYTDAGSLDIVPAVRCRKRRIRKMAERSSPPARASHMPYKP